MWLVRIGLCRLVGIRRFNSDFFVRTKCESMFAVVSFRNSPAQFFKPAWCSSISKLSDSLVNILFYFSLLGTLLRWCLTFLLLHHFCSSNLLLLNYDLFIKVLNKVHIRQFMQKKAQAKCRKHFKQEIKNRGPTSTH